MEVLLIVFFATGKPGRHDKRRSQKTCLCNYDFDLQDYGFESKYFLQLLHRFGVNRDGVWLLWVKSVGSYSDRTVRSRYGQ